MTRFFYKFYLLLSRELSSCEAHTGRGAAGGFGPQALTKRFEWHMLHVGKQNSRDPSPSLHLPLNMAVCEVWQTAGTEGQSTDCSLRKTTSPYMDLTELSVTPAPQNKSIPAVLYIEREKLASTLSETAGETVTTLFS